MKILFISSREMVAPNLAYRLKQEGHEVKLYLPPPELSKNFEGLVEKTDDWKRELPWVGKDGLIVFDDIGSGKVQSELRQQGYSVFGGSEKACKLESDRDFAQKTLNDHGIKTVEIKTFKNIPAAIEFIKTHPGAWVIKQNGHSSKGLNYVSMFDDGRDIINVLENYSHIPKYKLHSITLQRRIDGIEIGVGRYFNGQDWVGPIEINIEHKKLFPGGLGPATGEMGTLAWYDDHENNRLFQETLAKLKPHLQKIDYRGDIDLNCIVNQDGAFPLEITPRLGTPAIYLHDEIHESPWAEFLKALADGQPYDLKWRRGYGVVITVAVPPFPYGQKLKEFLPSGLNLYFDPTLPADSSRHVHFEGVSLKQESGRDQYYISDPEGSVLYLSAMGTTVEEAQKQVYDLARKIQVPKMFYRNDIGTRFVTYSANKLKELGYL